MSTTTYKRYTILTVGFSRYIFRPGQEVPQRGYADAPGYAQSAAEARGWINQDIAGGIRPVSAPTPSR